MVIAAPVQYAEPLHLGLQQHDLLLAKQQC